MLRVEESDFDSPNIFFTFNFKISILVYTEQTTIKNSTILAIRVARAAPLIPILGAPNNTKIKIAFKIPFTISPTKLAHIGS